MFHFFPCVRGPTVITPFLIVSADLQYFTVVVVVTFLVVVTVVVVATVLVVVVVVVGY